MHKEINKIKLAITTECNLECDYCFVNKTNEKMNFSTAKHAIDILLNSKGKDKFLSIYGGEPLLNFELFKKICPYAKSSAKKLDKNLVITMCTNFTLFRETHSTFFKKFNIRLIISMVGERKYHNRVRNFNNDQGSYDLIIEKLPLLFKVISPEHVGASFCIFPSTVNNMERNFKHLIKLGFNHINFEIIRDYEKWTSDRVKEFVLGFNKILNYSFFELLNTNFIFFNPINWEIKYRTLTKSLTIGCPFHYKFEVYPKGEISFSPFLFNYPEKNDYIIGNVNNSILKRFNDCHFDAKSRICQNCEYEYFKCYSSDRGASEVYRYYRLLCLKASQEIIKRSRNTRLFNDYIKRIKSSVCF